MYNQSRLYELSFGTPPSIPGLKPGIIVSVREAHFEEILERLQRVIEGEEENASLYCKEPVTFDLGTPEPNLFGNVMFGYGGCATLVREDGNIHIHLAPEPPPRLYCATLTFHVLAQTLIAPLERSPAANEPQQVDLLTRCEHNEMYGHAVTGYVSPSFTSWIRKMAGDAEEEGALSYVPVPEPVVEAMQITWRNISKRELWEWARDCSGRLVSDGRFMLECFGNACDLAIYPDQLHGYPIDRSTQFGCHNLDSAVQQFTLLAGFAKLCELARADKSD